MCVRFACGLAPDVVRRLSTYMNSQTQELTLPPFIDLMSSTKPFRSSWNLSPTSTWYDQKNKQQELNDFVSSKMYRAKGQAVSRIVCDRTTHLLLFGQSP
jgi:hypothetical protein